MDERLNKYLGRLIMQLATGDTAVLENIYKIMCKILYHIGYGHLKQKADVEDAIQNLLEELHTKAHKFKQNKNACAWVIKIFQNSIFNGIAKKKREELLVIEVFNDAFARNSVDEDYLENHLFLKEIFEHLSRYEQDLIIYKHWCGFSIREVAKILHKPKSSIENHLIKLQQKVNKL